VLGADYARLGHEVAQLEAAGVVRRVLDQVDVLVVMTATGRGR
jgi:hypothetical protein